MELILVGIGGILGGISRYLLGAAVSAKAKKGFPLGTFIINISGALLLGIIVGSGVGGRTAAFLGDGFCGAYTTFSTFMYEGFCLIRGNKMLNAAIYIALTLLLGIAGFSLGYMLARMI